MSFGTHYKSGRVCRPRISYLPGTGWSLGMANLYGIESEDVCRATIDGLLEMTRRAEKAMDKEKVSALRCKRSVSTS